jgi:cytochrome c1
MKYIRYRDLLKLGYTAEEVEALRGERDVDSPLTSMMDDETANVSFGKVPPDLSLMALAREGGGRYIYSLITSYYVTANNDVDNHVFPGIKMPDVLGFSGTTDPAQRAELEKMVQDLAVFLEWAADPQAPDRRSLGVYVLIYLAVLTVLLYFLKRKIWRKLD